MRKFVVLLFLITGAVCIALVLAGAPFAPASFKKASVPKQVRDNITYLRQQEKKSALKVFFSHQEFFYDKPIQVSLSADQPGADVYFTLDGSDPSVAGTLYASPIRLDMPDGAGCTVIRAVAVKGEKRSRVQSHSYFLGKDSKRRFTSYIFSLATDPDNLFGHETGILVPGKIYDDYMRDNASPAKSLWRRPANYNERGPDWERPLSVEAFTPDGARILDQLAGVRVKGESSRGMPQKSLRLIARKRYDARRGKFTYPLFPELYQAIGHGAPILGYDSIVLNNGGSIYGSTRLTDPLVLRLAREAGYTFASPVRSSSVFLNGRYYGHAWLMAQYNEQYLKALFDAPEAAFEILDGGEHKIYSKNPLRRYEFWQLHRSADRDMNDENVYGWFNSVVDVDNLLFYMAIELYTANCDWPRSNVRMWRYSAAGDKGTAPHEALDGRWRYILYDVQRAMDTREYPEDEESSRSHFSYKSLHYARETIPFLRALLGRRDLADTFANYLCDLAFVHFAEDKVEKTVDGLLEESLHEFRYAAQHSSGGPVPDIPAMLMQERERLILFSRLRPEYIVAELRQLFGYGDLFSIDLEGPGRINTVTGGQGRYFVESTVPVFPDPPKWEAFDHWLVNGKKRDERKLLVTGKDAINGRVSVTLVTRPEKPVLYLSDPYDRGKLCGFSLRNSTDTSRTTDGLYLSDTFHDLKKWPMPGFTVAPGGTIELVGQSYRSKDAILKVQLNFNPRQGEIVYLSNEAGDILDSIAIP